MHDVISTSVVCARTEVLAGVSSSRKIAVAAIKVFGNERLAK